MANVAHASLTGLELHEPKGADAAALGTVYVADGAGSGNWSSVGTSAFTGVVADFLAPVVPAGWLELDGSIISTSTYDSLFAVLAMTTSGTRTNGSAVITSIPSTSNFKVGYYVFGTGIATGTTIVSVDSATQITITGTASSSGTSAFYVSPFVMNTGTITLPNLTSNGRFRRSRSSGTKVGDLQIDQNKAHTHSVIGTSGSQNANHQHSVVGTTQSMNSNVTHTHSTNAAYYLGNTSDNTPGSVVGVGNGATIDAANIDHTHSINLATGIEGTNHQHSINFTSGSTGDAEARPYSITVITCIKT